MIEGNLFGATLTLLTDGLVHNETNRKQRAISLNIDGSLTSKKANEEAETTEAKEAKRSEQNSELNEARFPNIRYIN